MKLQTLRLSALVAVTALGAFPVAGRAQSQEIVKDTVPKIEDPSAADPYLWLEDVTGEKQLN